MKKLLLVGALALATVFGANAQDGLEGKWFVGGQFGYNHSKTKGTDMKSDTYTILPTIGTFISPDVAIGAQLGYAGGKTNGLKGNQVTIAPLARKYWNISGGLFFFGQASLPVSFGDHQRKGWDSEGEEIVEKEKNFGVNVQLRPGFDYIINGKFSVETSFNILTLGYTNSKYRGIKTNAFGFFANEGSSFGDLMIGFKMIF